MLPIVFFKTLFLSLVIISCSFLSVQAHEDGAHEHHQNEIGLANSGYYFLKEKSWSYGLHLHYIRNIGSSPFGIGVG